MVENGGGKIIKKFDIVLYSLKLLILQSKYCDGEWSLIFVFRVFSSMHAIISK